MKVTGEILSFLLHKNEEEEGVIDKII